MSTEEKEKKAELRVDIDAGTILDGKYKILSVLGRGGMGTVYKVEQILLRKNFALKMLQSDDTSDVAWRRFQKEAQAISKLDHPNLVREHDFGLIDGAQPYLVMDLVEGETLSQRIKQVVQLSLEEALDIFVPVCFALGYAHSQGIVHRDIKPSNIILCEAPNIDSHKSPKIVDFGIAKIIGDETNSKTLTRTGEIFGTPFYMSPEQCRGEGVDARSDIYSLGCVLFEALTGTPPFPGDSPVAVISQHLGGQALSLKESSLGKAFPTELERIVAKMIAKDPSDRYQNAEAVAKDLLSLKHSPTAELVQSIQAIAAASGQRGNIIFRPEFGIMMVICLFVGGFIGFKISPQVTPAPIVTYRPPAPIVPLQDHSFRVESNDSLQYYSSDKPDTGKPFQKQFEIPPDARGQLTIFEDGANGKRTYLPPEGGILPCNGAVICEVNPVACGLRPEILLRFRKNDLSSICFKCYATLPPLRGGKQLVNASLNYIRPLESVRRLDVEPLEGYEKESIDDRGLLAVADMPNLEQMNVVRCDVTGDGLTSIRNFANFYDLSLGGNKNMGKALAFLGDKATRMNRLHIRQTKLSAEELASIGRIHCLKRLSLEDDFGINDNTVRSLSGLTNLNGLTLTTTQVKDALSDILPKFPHLVDLDLSFTPISHRTLQTIAKMHKLVQLRLSGTGVRPDDLKAFTGLSELKRLQLDADLITPETVEYLAQLPSLQEVQLDSTGDPGPQLRLLNHRLRKLRLSGGTRRGSIKGDVNKEFDALERPSQTRNDLIETIEHDFK